MCPHANTRLCPDEATEPLKCRAIWLMAHRSDLRQISQTQSRHRAGAHVSNPSIQQQICKQKMVSQTQPLRCSMMAWISARASCVRIWFLVVDGGHANLNSHGAEKGTIARNVRARCWQQETRCNDCSARASFPAQCPDGGKGGVGCSMQ